MCEEPGCGYRLSPSPVPVGDPEKPETIWVTGTAGSDEQHTDEDLAALPVSPLPGRHCFCCRCLLGVISVNSVSAAKNWQALPTGRLRRMAVYRETGKQDGLRQMGSQELTMGKEFILPTCHLQIQPIHKIRNLRKTSVHIFM